MIFQQYQPINPQRKCLKRKSHLWASSLKYSLKIKNLHRNLKIQELQVEIEAEIRIGTETRIEARVRVRIRVHRKIRTTPKIQNLLLMNQRMRVKKIKTIKIEIEIEIEIKKILQILTKSQVMQWPNLLRLLRSLLRLLRSLLRLLRSLLRSLLKQTRIQTLKPPRRQLVKIGRASCRERV